MVSLERIIHHIYIPAVTTVIVHEMTLVTLFCHFLQVHGFRIINPLLVSDVQCKTSVAVTKPLVSFLISRTEIVATPVILYTLEIL